MRNACDLCSFNATCNFYALFTLITLYSLYKLYISSIYENYFSCIECWLILFLLITIYFVYDSVFLPITRVFVAFGTFIYFDVFIYIDILELSRINLGFTSKLAHALKICNGE